MDIQKTQPLIKKLIDHAQRSIYHPCNKKMTNTKKSILFDFALVAMVIAATFSNSGKIQAQTAKKQLFVNETRPCKAFHTIRVSTVVNVHFEPADHYSLEVHVMRNMLPNIRTEVQDSVLKIYCKDLDNNQEKIDVYVWGVDIHTLILSGAVDFEHTGMLQAECLNVTLSGASEAQLHVDAKHVQLNLSGVSEVDLSGYVEHLDAMLSGNSELDAKRLTIDTMNVETSGTSEAEMGISKTAAFTASGISRITYQGTPNIIRQQISRLSCIKNKHTHND